MNCHAESHLRCRAVVIGGRKLGRLVIVFRDRRPVRHRHGRRRLHRTRAGVILGSAVKHGRIVPGRQSPVAVRVIIVVALASTVRVGVAVAAVVAALPAVVLMFVVVHLHTLIGLVAVGRHGKGLLVGVNVVGAGADLAVVVAGQGAVEVGIGVCVAADKGGGGKEEAVFGVRLVFYATRVSGRFDSEGKNVRVEDAKTDNGLAELASVTAEVGRVVGGLRGKGREPENGAKQVDAQHGPRGGEAAGASKARCHDEVDPRGDGDEALEKHRVSMYKRGEARKQEAAKAALTTPKVHPLLPTTLAPFPVKTAISRTQTTKEMTICTECRMSLKSGTRSGSSSTMVGCEVAFVGGFNVGERADVAAEGTDVRAEVVGGCH